ncbi:unnamed protein product [Bursaphelenchus xylophilus]|uniref:(pine wood nematode) hypothetical protein n=1 Tax=Bursaphelenchus xylophilus TaxID=6326 RepID=A0A1I7RPD7_BURXY|nr:unnamed protein product [Bursaphelenchus xylophilus]CAG9095851.1 unnamed protein product [Bursaphelenchus xylophilus]
MSSDPVQLAQLQFSTRLLKELASKDTGNVVVSPISILTVLSMVYSGAANETKEEFNEVLGYNGEEDDWNKHFSILLNAFEAKEKPYTLNSANKIFLRNGFDLKQSFKDKMEKFFLNAYQELDFDQKTEAVQTINKFIEDHTGGKITDLVDESNISELTKLVVVNALYFKSTWEKKFDKNKTEDKVFFVKPDQAKKVKMMKKEAKFIYYDETDFQLLGLPYAGEGVYLFVLLPREKFGADDLLKTLDAEKLKSLISRRYKVKVDVELPRFKINSKTKLNDAMKNIGLQKGFGIEPEFTEIAEERLKIDELLHQVFIETNEEGSEAAAATGAVLNLLSAMPLPEEEIRFVADHPFLFFVATKYSDVLFTGIVRDF